MNAVTQKISALSIASIFTLALFTLADIDQTSHQTSQISEVSSQIQQVTIIGQRMTSKQKIAFDANKSGNFS